MRIPIAGEHENLTIANLLLLESPFSSSLPASFFAVPTSESCSVGSWIVGVVDRGDPLDPFHRSRFQFRHCRWKSHCLDLHHFQFVDGMNQMNVGFHWWRRLVEWDSNRPLRRKWNRWRMRKKRQEMKKATRKGNKTDWKRDEDRN